MADGDDGGGDGGGGEASGDVAHLGVAFGADTDEVTDFTGRVAGLGDEAVAMGGKFDDTADRVNTNLRSMSAGAGDMGSAFREAFDSVKDGINVLGVSFGFFAGGEAVKGILDVSSRFQELGAVMDRVGENAGNSRDYLRQQEEAVEALGVGAETARQALVRMQQGQIDLSHATDLTTASQNFAVASGLDLDTAEQDLIRAIASGNSFILKRAGLNVDWKRGENEVADAVHANGRALTESEQEQGRYIAVIEATQAVNGAWAASMSTPAGAMRRLGIQAQELKTQLGDAIGPEFAAALREVGDAMIFAGQHTTLVEVAATALAARGIAPVVARLGESTLGWLRNTDAVLMGRTAAVQAAQAELVLASAAQKVADAEVNSARLSTVAAGMFRDSATAATEAAVANDALAAAYTRQGMASARVAAADTMVAAAEADVTAASITAAAGVGALDTAMGLLGGPVGVAILAAAAAWAHYSGEVAAANAMNVQNSEGMQEQATMAAREAKELRDLAAAHGQAAPRATLTETQKKADDERSGAKLEAQDFIDDRAFTATRTGTKAVHDLDVAEMQLMRDMLDGKRTAGDMDAAFEKLKATYGDQTESLADFNAAWQRLAASMTDAQKASEKPLTGPAKQMADYQLPGPTYDKGTQSMLDQVADREKLIAATKQGGEVGQRAAEQSAEGAKAAVEWYTQWADATKNASAAQRTLKQAAALTDQEIMGLAEQQNAAKFAAVGSQQGSKAWADAVGETTTELVKARMAALGFDEAGKTLANDIKLAEAATLHAANAYKDLNTGKEVTDTIKLTAAVTQGAAAYRAMEVAAKGNAAYRGLAQGSTDADREQARATAIVKAEADQREAIAKTNNERQIAANDAALMALANTQGVAATVAATQAVKAQHDADAGLAVALSYNIEMNERLTESQNKAIGTIDTQIEAAQRATQNTMALTAAQLQSKSAVENLTIAQRVMTTVDALDLSAKDKQIKAQQLYAALVQSQAATDTDAAAKTATELKQSADLLNGQTAAINEGSGALRDYNVWMAGQVAVNRLAADTTASVAAQVRELAEAEEQARQRNQAAQSNRKETDKDESRPLAQAFHGMENDAGEFFDTLLSHGHNAFQTLWDDMVKTFLKALSDMIASQALEGLTRIFGQHLRSVFGLSGADPHGAGTLPAGTAIPTSTGPDVAPAAPAAAAQTVSASALVGSMLSPASTLPTAPSGLDAQTASNFGTFVDDFHTVAQSVTGQATNQDAPLVPQAAAIKGLGLNIGQTPSAATTETPMEQTFGAMMAHAQAVPGSAGWQDVNPDVEVPHETVTPEDTIGTSESPPTPQPNTQMDQIPAAPPVSVGAPGMSVGQGAGVVLGAATGGYAVGNAAGHAKLGTVGDVAVGTLGGAAEGAAAGAAAGPAGMAIGAVVGAVAGFVGSITGMSDAAHQVAEALKDAQQSLYASTTQFTQSITGSNLSTTLASFEDAAGSLYAQGKKANFSQNDPNNAGLQNLENIVNQNPQQRQQMYQTQESEGKTPQEVTDEITYAQQVISELKTAIYNSTQDFVDSMTDQLQKLQTGVGGDAGALQQAKEQEESNIASADAMGNATAKQQALTEATALYAAEVANITETQKLAIAAQASAVSQFQDNLAISAAQAENNTGLAASEQFAAQQAEAMAQAIQQWSITNPQLITQLQQVQALQAANYAANLAQSADDASDALKVRAAQAAGATDQAATLNLQLQQAQEMRAAISQWESTNPQLIQQLQQVQQLEMQTLLTNQQNAVTQEQGSLQARALQAEGFSQQASIITLQLQQTQELQQATEEWGQSNPGLITQLKQVQALELQNAETALNTAEVNAAQGFKVQQYAYDFSGYGNPNPPAPGTGTTTPVSPVQPGQVPYTPAIPGGSTPGGAATTGATQTTPAPGVSNASAQTPAPLVTPGTADTSVAAAAASQTTPTSSSSVSTDTSDESPTDFLSLTELPPVLTFFALSTLPPVLDFLANGTIPASLNAPSTTAGLPATSGSTTTGAPANPSPSAPTTNTVPAGLPAAASGVGGATQTGVNDQMSPQTGAATSGTQTAPVAQNVIPGLSPQVQAVGGNTQTGVASAALPGLSASGPPLQLYTPASVPRATPPPSLPVSAAPPAGVAAGPTPSAASGGTTGPQGSPTVGRPVVIQALNVTVQANDGTDISALFDKIVQEAQDRSLALTGYTTNASDVFNGGTPSS